MKVAASVAAAAALVDVAVASVPSIVIKGSKFFYENNGTEFFIRGVAYQPPYDGTGTTTSAGSVDFVDPLANETICKRDLPYLQELNTNVVRVYDIDPDADHTTCMNLLADAGIYVLADLSTSDYSIVSSDPQWNLELYDFYASVVDSLANYTNTLGFFAGNENSNSANTTGASAFVKAAVRDMKAYIKTKGYRSIGVGYSAADVTEIRDDLVAYFNCGDQDDAVDFFGDNVYEWCGDSTYTESGYNVMTEDLKNYSVPYFFSEYGCITVQPRSFSNVPVMYGSEMDYWLSGGIVYEYFQDANDYGLVSISDGDVVTSTAFSSYSKEINSVSPTGTNSASYTPTNTVARSCPTVGSSWDAASNLPPAPNAELCSCMSETLSCVVKDSVSSKDYSDLFSTVCGYGVCAGIDTNTTSGVYGAYSMCSSKQMLNWALNAYYEEQKSAGNGASACDFAGSATTTSTTSPTGTCSSLLKAVGTAGTGTVSLSAAAGTSTGDSSASGSKSSSAGVPGYSSYTTKVGLGQVVVFVAVGLLSGTGMILL
ncbi:glycoside hydrolase family 72 protein [Aspergillus ibericus CBS 121593]|uniref:1,3-beta-glucanosyltransferase n=1 Tax=Aspergillus ibericus CBS 121593 TaxID=1448316 RepID=A0A395GVQ7_9EURO|nr:1,3-beta-glucanosyltransferase [Aspergillus ibericus CBS 121593]RAK99596.1 1,3-beta-glucanosyltransferase [Aspergillus ibericus CBS 121593]